MNDDGLLDGRRAVVGGRGRGPRPFHLPVGLGQGHQTAGNQGIITSGTIKLAEAPPKRNPFLLVEILI